MPPIATTLPMTLPPNLLLNLSKPLAMPLPVHFSGHYPLSWPMHWRMHWTVCWPVYWPVYWSLYLPTCWTTVPRTLRWLGYGAVRLLALVLLLSAAACAPEVGDDLRAWAARVRSEAPGPGNEVRVVPVPTAFAYEAAGRRDPFDASKLSTELSDPDLVLRPDAGRAREVLEAFQLDSLQMVGSLRRGKKAVAIVQAERQLHQVRVGDHLGQDYGEVTAISEDAIAIAERVQDNQGKWQMRETQLALRRGGAK